MRLVAVSIVKNEADIIEAFVRHTRTWVDHHLIFDHDSTDGTREILAALAREGLTVSLFTDDALGNLQQARSNALTRLAVADHGADWVLPLDADEFLVAPDRAALESALGDPGATTPVTLPLANYYPTEQDDTSAASPVLRLQHRAALSNASRKLIVPRALAADAGVAAGKGSHVLYRGEAALPDRPLPAGCHLAHFALRSLGQQVLRVVTAELQKLGRGQAHAGLDVHYRLGFQLLAEHPDRFEHMLVSRARDLTRDPVPYRGEPLRYTGATAEWMRVSRALLPFLEKLARSHGELADRTGGVTQIEAERSNLRALLPAEIPTLGREASTYFAGFRATAGLGPDEGPFAGAFLPRFRWGMAPATTLEITAAAAGTARLEAEALTYWDGQVVTPVLNGVELPPFAFPRVNQKERLERSLPLRAGANTLQLRYSRHHASTADPRPLAVIYLSIRISPVLS
jgi:hypothetical protein